MGVRTSELAAGDLVDLVGNDSQGRTRRGTIGDVTKKALNAAAVLNTAAGTFVIIDASGEIKRITLPAVDSRKGMLLGFDATTGEPKLFDGSQLGGEVNADELQEYVDAANAATAAAEAAQDAAETAAELAQSWASADRGVAISNGLESALSSALTARDIAQASRAVATRVINDTDLVSGVYTLQSSDLYKLLRFKNTAACSLKCPKNLWTGPGESYVALRREGAAVTVVAETAVTGTRAPSLASTPVEIAARVTGTVATLTATKTVTLPALTGGGKVLISIASSFATTETHTVQLTAPGLTLTQLLNDADTSANGIRHDVWEATLPTNYAGGDVTFTAVAGNACNVMEGWIYCIKDTAGRSATNSGVNTGKVNNASNATIPSFAATANSRLIIHAVMRDVGASPATLGGGAERLATGDTKGVPTGYDNNHFYNASYVSGNKLVSTAGSQALSATFAIAGRISMVAIAYDGVADSSSQSNIYSAGSRVQLAETYQKGDLTLADDGVSYFLEIGKIA